MLWIVLRSYCLPLNKFEWRRNTDPSIALDVKFKVVAFLRRKARIFRSFLF